MSLDTTAVETMAELTGLVSAAEVTLPVVAILAVEAAFSSRVVALGLVVAVETVT